MCILLTGSLPINTPNTWKVPTTTQSRCWFSKSSCCHSNLMSPSPGAQLVAPHVIYKTNVQTLIPPEWQGIYIVTTLPIFTSCNLKCQKTSQFMENHFYFKLNRSVKNCFNQGCGWKILFVLFSLCGKGKR